MACPMDTMAVTSMIRISTEAASPSRWSAFGTRPKSASLTLMISTSMNAVNARPSDMARDKRVMNQQVAVGGAGGARGVGGPPV